MSSVAVVLAVIALAVASMVLYVALGVRRDMRSATDALRDGLVSLAEQNESHAQLLTGLRVSIDDAERSTAVLREQTDERLTSRRGLLDELRTSVQDAKDRTAVVREQADQRFAAQSGVLDELRTSVQDAKDRTAAIREQADQRFASQGRVLEGLREVATNDVAQIRRQVASFSGARTHQMDRTVSDEELSLLAQTASDLGVDLPEKHLHYLISRVLVVEHMCRGRMAAPAATAVSRAIACLGADVTDTLRIMEIGTLHSVAAAYLHDTLAPRFDTIHQTLVDPFFGYYGDTSLDLATPVPVSEAVARDNLKRSGVQPDQYEICVGLAESPEIIRHLANRKFNVVIIDGDHSYEGVERDFNNYASHVESGGILIVDDYAGPSWPDVTRFVDDVVAKDARFDFVSGRCRTAIFRKQRIQDA